MYVSTPDRAKSGEPIQHRFTSTSSGSQCMPVCGDGFRIEPAASRKFRAGPFQGGLTARLRLGPAAEECDDGNNLVSAPASRGEREPRRCLWEAGDGCDPVCQVEVGWRTKVQATPPPPPPPAIRAEILWRSSEALGLHFVCYQRQIQANCCWNPSVAMDLWWAAKVAMTATWTPLRVSFVVKLPRVGKG